MLKSKNLGYFLADLFDSIVCGLRCRAALQTMLQHAAERREKWPVLHFATISFNRGGGPGLNSGGKAITASRALAPPARLLCIEMVNIASWGPGSLARLSPPPPSSQNQSRKYRSLQ